MILTESHIIGTNKELDELTFKTKNLYNKSNYMIRQEFINNGRYISRFEMQKIMKCVVIVIHTIYLIHQKIHRQMSF